MNRRERDEGVRRLLAEAVVEAAAEQPEARRCVACGRELPGRVTRAIHASWCMERLDRLTGDQLLAEFNDGLIDWSTFRAATAHRKLVEMR